MENPVDTVEKDTLGFIAIDGIGMIKDAKTAHVDINILQKVPSGEGW